MEKVFTLDLRDCGELPAALAARFDSLTAFGDVCRLATTGRRRR